MYIISLKITMNPLNKIIKTIIHISCSIRKIVLLYKVVICLCKLIMSNIYFNLFN